MPLDEKELLKRDSKRNIGEELIQSVRDIKAGRVGQVSTERDFCFPCQES